MPVATVIKVKVDKYLKALCRLILFCPSPKNVLNMPRVPLCPTLLLYGDMHQFL